MAIWGWRAGNTVCTGPGGGWGSLLLPRPRLSLLTPLSLLQHFFTSFGARDRCFLLIFRLWQNALLEKVGLWSPGHRVRGWAGGDYGVRGAGTRGS